MSDNYRRQSQQNRSNTNIAVPVAYDVQAIFNQNKGNFSLWFNKCTPIVVSEKEKELYHTYDYKGNTFDALNHYIEMYNGFSATSKEKLELLHKNLQAYLLSFPEQDYEVIELKATTKTPLITGIGQTHPNEVSMVFDYMLGIPYIPASSIKGLLRFTTVKKEINDNIKKYNNVKEGKIDDESIAEIQYYFGGQSNEGSVVFLDAYPQNIPNLHIDIMNPHYGEYYQDAKPPADYLEPTPKKFLTVAPNTIFIFRVIINKHKKNYENIKQIIKTILEQALTKEGIGAKTALGYGIFTVDKNNFSNLENERQKKAQLEQQEAERIKLESMSELDKLIMQINRLSKETGDFNKSVEIYNSLDKYQIDDKIKIAQELKRYFQKINKWEKQSGKQFAKVEKIKKILGEQ
ncbi:MAG TPA: type III-B CRISPR module RAMP protein Cmr6 [Spirochaetales bacterium]|nr:type III-B CRISPR module RAMP protein Cmr6 [Spirochaetales bacterium]